MIIQRKIFVRSFLRFIINDYRDKSFRIFFKLSFPFGISFIPVNFTIHFSESRMEIGRVTSICARIIFIVTIIGTERSVPIGPQSVPQNIREMRITSGLKFSLFPISFGSNIFHVKT